MLITKMWQCLVCKQYATDIMYSDGSLYGGPTISARSWRRAQKKAAKLNPCYRVAGQVVDEWSISPDQAQQFLQNLEGR